MEEIHWFRIAEHNVSILFKDNSKNNMSLLPSFEPFRANPISGGLFFSLTVDDQLRPIPKSRRERIRDFDTGNGNTIVDLLDDGGYQFIIKNISGGDCCLLIANKDFTSCTCALNGNEPMRRFGLNNALMMIYAFAGSKQDTLLIHASVVRYKDKGYAFIAKSGTGKSTQSSMWLRYIPGCDLMNDDNPIIRVLRGKAYIYGSPWSGKTPCYRNTKSELGAIVRIDRAHENSIEKLQPVQSFASFLPSCSSMKWDEDIFENICDIITKVVETNHFYILHCLPNREAAELCQKTVAP
ncbi:MAG: hypothetical protein LKE41_02550 [Prevotella sp.]|jgi:hypothetical protein|nr:hypothetical protein [Prevotella sp.]MCI2079868.1 hypothetical protein [Prevotella sp.]MCI2102132.1 hypothetical protein [Prevotella sp.]